jgi:Protein of unknown function (DUF1553)/Protein of unknown function (DUF1549)
VTKRWAWLLLCLIRPVAAEADFVSLHVEPAERTLAGPGTHQQLLVLGVLSTGGERDLTANTKWRVSDDTIAQVDARGVLTPKRDGLVIVTATVGSLQAQARIGIHGTGEVRGFVFGRDIGAILTRKGCNNPNCHGSVKGRGGFKLSVAALSPKEDYEWIVKGGAYQVLTAEVKGPRVPRIDLTNPEKSLLLQKPTLTVAHGGGRRFPSDSAEYRAILKWIQSGSPFGTEPAAGKPLVRLEVFPHLVTLESGEKHRLLVTGHSIDGRTEDLTDQASFVSNDSGIASVDEAGEVDARRPGETAVLVRAVGLVASSAVGVITERSGPYPSARRENYIDDFIFDKLRRFQIPPSEPASDSEFLRRVCLDLTGTLPPPYRVKEFLGDKDPRKREKVIDALMASPEFVDYWTFRFSDLFRVSTAANGVSSKWSEMYSEWLRQSIADNKPYDVMAEERIAAQGYDGPSRHYLPFDVVGPPGDTMAEEVRVFFGRRLDCAQCHNHPWEPWSQNQYWGMAAFFGRQFMLRGTTDTDREYVIFDRPTDADLGSQDVGRSWPAVIHPRTKVAVEPTLLDGTVVKVSARQNPRRLLAAWMVKQPYFAECAANRFWSYFFGRGLVEPVDDFRSTNPPTHPELLERMAEDFRSHQCDLRHLMRVIVTSAAYQLSGKVREDNQNDHTNYSHSQPRPLDAEVLLDAICNVIGVQEKFVALADADSKGGQAPIGTRAIGLGAPELFSSRFLEVYGRPNRLTVPERSGKPNLAEALDMLAGPVYNEKLHAPDGRLQGLLRAGKTNREIIQDFFVAALTRWPETAELQDLEKFVEAGASRDEGLQNLVWALVCSREFAENH